jgi:riboflavin kinase/FMN adenylyltransferase
MKIWTEVEELSWELNASVVTVGNFDGVHRGHRKLIAELVARAGRMKIPSVAVLFDPHPSVILGFPAPALLTRPEERVRMLYALGVKHCLIQPFTLELAHLSAGDFVGGFLLGRLRMKALCVGPTTHVGRGREGKPARLAELAKSFDFDFTMVPALQVQNQVVNSSTIRDLLREGKVAEASKLLGWTYLTKGKIVSGDGRGSRIGYPTANLGDVFTLLPKRGVYSTILRLEEALHRGATNVGVRPTFGGRGNPTVETHLLDFEGDLLHREVSIFWLERLRDEVSFGSVEELTRQIERDCAHVRKNIPPGGRSIEELK